VEEYLLTVRPEASVVKTGKIKRGRAIKEAGTSDNRISVIK